MSAFLQSEPVGHNPISSNRVPQSYPNNLPSRLSIRRRFISKSAFVLLATLILVFYANTTTSAKPNNSANRKSSSNNNAVSADSSISSASSEPVLTPQPSATSNQRTRVLQPQYTNSAQNSAQSSMQVTVNGQAIDVPASGSTQQTMTSDTGTTTVTVTSDQTTNGVNESSHHGLRTTIRSNSYDGGSSTTKIYQSP